MVIHEIPVLPLVPFNSGVLDQASEWYLRISHGLCHLRFILLKGPLADARGSVLSQQCTEPRPSGSGSLSSIKSYSHAGGKGEWPRNSQRLAADLIRDLDSVGLSQLQRGHGKLVLIATDDFLPHTWHIPNGGVDLGEGVLARRYAIVPSTPNLGVVAHEIGHLMFDWPDLRWPLDCERECLMAAGAAGERGNDPSPPCAPLLVRQGWRDPIPVTRELTPDALRPDIVGWMDWDGSRFLVEARGMRLLVYSAEPRPLTAFSLTPGDLERSLLGLLAPRLRRILPRGRIVD